MGLFGMFKKEEDLQGTSGVSGLGNASIYSGMRVEVTTFDGRILFVAKLMDPEGDTAELRQYSEADIPEGTESIHVRIRGYHDHEKKAVYMEGVIHPRPKHTWKVERFVVARVGNDRAFFRLDTDIEATVTKFTASGAEERPCRLLNLSVGGARIASEHQYLEGDKLLLRVQLFEDREISIIFCQVLRCLEKEEGPHEYGCQFLELTESEEGRITRNIFAAQRKLRDAGK